MTPSEKAGTFVPELLLRWIADGVTEKRFTAAVAFADVSGFTAMSEKLAAIGKEGAETLTGILNSYFSTMIGQIHARGGFVGKFGGDAMTIFFPAFSNETALDAVRRAVSCSLDLQREMVQFHSVSTRAGVYALGMKVGVGAGDVLFKVVEDETGSKDCLLAGKPLDEAAEAEHHGHPGDVVLCPEVMALCKHDGQFCGSEAGDGFLKVDPSLVIFESAALTEIVERTSEWNDLAKSFVDPAIYQRFLIGLDSVGEIRKVTILFLSFSGLEYDSDPAVGSKLDNLYSWVLKLTRTYNGSVNKVDMGDKGSKILLTFGAPVAHENDEALAIRCGLSLVAGQDDLLKWGVKCRAGIATGSVFSGEVGAPSRQEYTVMGRAVNLAARLMAKAGEGELLVDGASFQRVSEQFEFGDPIPTQMKGIAEPVPVRRVIGLKIGGEEGRLASTRAFVGRQAELDQIRGVIEEATTKKLRILVIRGDAGVGKTRLSQEVVGLLRERSFKIGAGEALSYAQGSPYLAMISILRGLMRLPSVSPEQQFIEIEKLVSEIDPDHSFRAPIVANLLGVKAPENEITKYLDAGLRQENLFDFLVIYIRKLSAASPVALMIEDSQWVDVNTLELLNYLSRNLADRSVLIFLVRRPYARDFVSPFIGQIEGGEHTRPVTVKEFDREATDEFIRYELKADRVDPNLLDFVFERGHGNPAFTEELLKSLSNLDRLSLTPSDGEVVASASGDLTTIEVPDSLNSLIMSQLDRLGPETKLTVKLAAVVGRRFSRELILDSYPIEMNNERVLQTLTELDQLDFIFKEEDRELIEYVFKNLLTRDVAYDSLLFAHRREYHHRIGVCLEVFHKEKINEYCEDLARHFYQSDDSNRAVTYLSMAGEKSAELYANESAEDYYSKALDRLSELGDPAARFKLLNSRSKVLSISGKSTELKQDLDAMLEASDQIGDLRGKVDTINALAQYYYRKNQLNELEQCIKDAEVLLGAIEYPMGWVSILSKSGVLSYARNNFKDALRRWEEGADVARKAEEKVGLSMALSNCGTAYLAMSELEQAERYFRQSIEIDHETGNLKSEAVNLGNIGIVNHRRGDLNSAMEAYGSALEIGKKIGSKEIQARNLGNLAVIYQSKGERKKTLDTHLEKLAMEQMMGYRRGQTFTLGNIGSWYAEDGDFDEAIKHYEEALQIVKELSLASESPRLTLNLGQTYHYRGDLKRAYDLLKRAADEAQALNQKVAEQYARGYLGYVLFDLGELDRADEQFDTSIAIATQMGAKARAAYAVAGKAAVALHRTGLPEPLVETLQEARGLGDIETLIKGSIVLAKWLMVEGDPDARKVLTDALEIAQGSGHRRDTLIIETMLNSLHSS